MEAVVGSKSYFFFRESREPEKTPGIQDVYWKPGFEEHGLPDDPKTGKPMVFGSKAEKAAYLKSHNLIEAGDKINGAKPNILEQTRKNEDKNAPEQMKRDRELAERSLANVRRMGQDYRRQEYLKIQSESRRISR